MDVYYLHVEETTVMSRSCHSSKNFGFETTSFAMRGVFLFLLSLAVTPLAMFAFAPQGTRRAPTAAFRLAAAPQLLEFQEPSTNVTVILVGAMHYNPASIALAADTVDTLGQQNALGSVIVEQCDIRWNKTIELLQEKPYLEPIHKKVLSNEMRVACDTALSYRRPVILGDQRVNLTFASIKDTFKQTAKELASPLQWATLFGNIKKSFDEAVPLGDGYLNAV